MEAGNGLFIALCAGCVCFGFEYSSTYTIIMYTFLYAEFIKTLRQPKVGGVTSSKY